MFDKFVCEGDTVKWTQDGFDMVAHVQHDSTADAPDEMSDGFWPSKDESAPGYVLPENYDEQQARAEHVMSEWRNQEWFYCGIAVTASKNDIELATDSLWGIECNFPDSDNSYLGSVAKGLAIEAINNAKGKIDELAR